MSSMTFYQRNRDVIVNTAKYYFENDKERLREQAWDKYRKNRYHSMSEEKKQKTNRISKKLSRGKKVSI